MSVRRPAARETSDGIGGESGLVFQGGLQGVACPGSCRRRGVPLGGRIPLTSSRCLPLARVSGITALARALPPERLGQRRAVEVDPERESRFDGQVGLQPAPAFQVNGQVDHLPAGGAGEAGGVGPPGQLLLGVSTAPSRPLRAGAGGRARKSYSRAAVIARGQGLAVGQDRPPGPGPAIGRSSGHSPGRKSAAPPAGTASRKRFAISWYFLQKDGIIRLGCAKINHAGRIVLFSGRNRSPGLACELLLDTWAAKSAPWRLNEKKNLAGIGRAGVDPVPRFLRRPEL